MKKILVLVALCLFAHPSLALAQEAQVIDIIGSGVQHRENSTADWYKTEVGEFLPAKAEIRTGLRGSCVISFDRENQNIITLEKNTESVIENLKPGAIFLRKGRIFSIIRDVEQIENFEIKTPTAAAGARGTGWTTEFTNGVTSIAVFEDDVSVTGLDENGMSVSSVDVLQEYAVTIAQGGHWDGKLERVSEYAKGEWNDKMNALDDIIPLNSSTSGSPAYKRPLSEAPESQENNGHVVEKMKKSGNYSEEEVSEMIDMLESGAENMTDEDLLIMTEIMDELDKLTPGEETTLEQKLDNKGQ